MTKPKATEKEKKDDDLDQEELEFLQQDIQLLIN